MVVAFERPFISQSFNRGCCIGVIEHDRDFNFLLLKKWKF